MIPAHRKVAVPLALIVVVLGGVVVWLSWNSARLVLAPIGPARIQPRIVCTAGTVIVLAPDGSLWTWGERLGEPSERSQFTRTLGAWARRIWLRAALGRSQAAALRHEAAVHPPVHDECPSAPEVRSVRRSVAALTHTPSS